MRWNKTAENEAALFFQAHYCLWALGQLELEVEQALDALTAGTGQENWKQVMQRECPWTPPTLHARFRELCETMGEEDALDALFEELGFTKTEAESTGRTRMGKPAGSSRRRHAAPRANLRSRFRLSHLPPL